MNPKREKEAAEQRRKMNVIVPCAAFLVGFLASKFFIERSN